MYKCTECWQMSTILMWKCKGCWAFWTLDEVKDQKEDKKWNSIILPKKYDYTWKSEERKFTRYWFESSSLNNIFWGWLVKWSVNYLSAEPGTWKSTFLWQLLWLLQDKNLKVVYYSWEENEHQVADRLKRLYQDDLEPLNRIDLYYWESLEEVLWIIERDSPDIVIIDSLQKIKSSEKEGDVWSISQQKYCIDKVTYFLKRQWVTGIIIWHVNKEWELAWAKSIEHIVDWVYLMEGQDWRTDSIRLLKSLKGRFWGTDNVVVMKMTSKWFEILDPENAFKAFVEESWTGVWSVFCPILEWNQLFLLEVQSLLTPMLFSNPKRTSIWISYQKLDIIIAVLMKQTGFALETKDIFLNIIWPVSKNTVWVDLSIVSSILSSILNIEIKNYVFVWQVWLLGEIRTIPKQDEIEKKLINMWYTNDQIISRNKYKTIRELLVWIFKVEV